MRLKEELIFDIGNLMNESATESNSEWTHAALTFIFSITDESSESRFLFSNENRLRFLEKLKRKEIRIKLLQLRQLMRVEDDIACPYFLLALKRKTLDFQMLFEFDDMSRWKIDFHNVHDQQKILFGEIWPEDFT